jgi:hypothetical protein
MSKTNQFKLPLLQASQAQKHVMVNEAIARLDAVAQLRLEAMNLAIPPSNPIDAQAYWVPFAATDVWTGYDESIAISSNGGWVFLIPKVGWKAWVVDESIEKRFDGSAWVEINSGGDLSGPLGSSFGLEMLEFEHVITAGSANSTIPEVPAGSMVAMVAFRVSETVVTDSATSWRFGISNSVARYGSGYSLAANSNGVAGINRSMFYYPAARQLYISPPAGNFVSGKIIFTVYVLKLGLPNAV